MCLVIDTCCLPDVFNSNNRLHSQYKPILRWISNGNGKLIYGGTKYKNELKKLDKVRGFLVELHRQGRLIDLGTQKVDRLHSQLERKVPPNAKFNDHHLVAIVIISKCRIICSRDQKATSLFKNSKFYSKGVKKPKLYKKISHLNLICDKNIAAICRED